MTPGKAGGLLGERLKGADNIRSRPRRLYPSQPHLVVTLVRLLLLADIRSDHRFVQTHGRHKIPARPKHLAGKVPFPTPETSGDQDRAFTLEVPYDIRYRVLRRNTQAHVHVIQHQVPFYDPRLLMRRKLVKNLSQVLA